MARINPEIKRLAHERAQGRCERCGAKYRRSNWEGHVHHITYERAGNEHLADVIVLCLACHNREHPHHEFVDRRTQKRRASQRHRKSRKRRKLDNAKKAARQALKKIERKEKRLRREFGARD